MSYHDAFAQIIKRPNEPDDDNLYEAEKKNRRDLCAKATNIRRIAADQIALLTEAVSIIQEYVDGVDSSSGDSASTHGRAVAFLRTLPAPGKGIGADVPPGTDSPLCPSCGRQMEDVPWSEFPRCLKC